MSEGKRLMKRQVAKIETATNHRDKVTVFWRGWSGRVDLNHRPLGPEPSALNQTAPCADLGVIRL